MLATVDLTLRELLRDVIRTEIAPIVREEIRSALVSLAAKPADDDALLSTTQAGAIAGVEPETICCWIRKGKLSGTKTPGGGPWRIRRVDLDRCRPPEKKSSADGPMTAERGADQILAKYLGRMKGRGD